MSENNFDDLVRAIKGVGNFDHPDFDQIDSIGKKKGFNPGDARQAFFVARDLKTLEEAEMLDGGNGSETAKAKPSQVLATTFAKGKK